MYIMVPITPTSEHDILGYWIAIEDNLLNRLWSEVTNPVRGFLKDKFQESAEEVLEIPVKYINPDEGWKYRKLMLDLWKSGGELNLPILYASHIKPTVPDRSSGDSFYDVMIGFMTHADMKNLEFDIYEFFMETLYSRLENLFVSAFPNVHNGDIPAYILQCPSNDDDICAKMTDEDVDRFLSNDHLYILRMENVTFNSLTDDYMNKVQNHTRVIAEAMAKRTKEFIHAINEARSDGFDIALGSMMYPPLLGVCFRYQDRGNAFCSISIYKDGVLYGEKSFSMYTNNSNADVPDDKYLYEWYNILNDMNAEGDSIKNWVIVMTNLIHM